jgi:hypothetical protein
MSFPDNRKDLEAVGYEFINDGVCRGCGDPIQWYATPKDKRLPMSIKIVGTLAEGNRREVLEPHWGVCPSAQDFRKKR